MKFFSGQGVKGLKADEIVKCLHACAGRNGDSCKQCLKAVGYGCARDLKMEAAAMIQSMAAEIEKAGRECDGKSRL